jgi:hypothetical protein
VEYTENILTKILIHNVSLTARLAIKGVKKGFTGWRETK